MAAAAYQAAKRLHDECFGRDHGFTAKAGVVHREVMLLEGAPGIWSDRATREGNAKCISQGVQASQQW